MSQTQPEVRVLMEDIFGSDSEDEPEQEQQELKSSKAPLRSVEKEDGEVENSSVEDREEAPKTASNGIFGSDDESQANASDDSGEIPKRKLQKGGKSRVSISKKDSELVDSDAEEEVNNPRKRPKFSRKRVRPGEKEGTDAGKERIRNRIKRSGGTKKKERGTKSSRLNTEDGGGEDDGDAYDSGEEVQATKDDIDFIDNENDEHADLVREYERDNPQNFREDEIDEGFTQQSKKSSKKPSAVSSTGDRLRARDQDPLSQVLLEMKKPKAQVLDDASKERIVNRLQEQMARAVELDAAAVTRGEPAMLKLQLLPALQRAVGMRALQQTLLDQDSGNGSILCSIRDWIEPRDSRTLPALAVRSAVYQMLLNQIHPSAEQLKKTRGRGLGQCTAPIGEVIVALRKHKLETPENKKLLKEIMEKWSRPIFSKLVDERGGKNFLSTAESITGERLQQEIKAALLQKYKAEEQQQQQQQQVEQKGARKSQSQRQSVEQPLDVEAVLSGTVAAVEEDPNKEYNRVRTPYSQGFLFNVQPAMKSLDKGNRMEKVLGEGRMRLFDKMVGSRGGGMGKKTNPRAFDMKI